MLHFVRVARQQAIRCVCLVPTLILSVFSFSGRRLRANSLLRPLLPTMNLHLHLLAVVACTIVSAFEWRGVNYYASRAGWIDQWCAGWNRTLIETIDTEFAQSLHVNQVRTFIQFTAVESGCNGNTTADGVLDRLSVFADIASKR